MQPCDRGFRRLIGREEPNLSSADWIGIAGLVVGLIGIPLTWFLARRSRQRPDLRYAVSYEKVITPADRLSRDGLRLEFSGKPIERLARTTVGIWNRRGDTIRGTDIVSTNPMRICMSSGDEVLQARIVASTRPENAASVAVGQDRSAAVVSFDFLDAGDALVVEVLHEGSAPDMKGVLRGVNLRLQAANWRPTRKNAPDKNFLRRVLLSRWIHVPLILATPVLFGVYFWGAFIDPSRPGVEPDLSNYDMASRDGRRTYFEAMRDFQQFNLDDPLTWLTFGLLCISTVMVSFIAWADWRKEFAVPRYIERLVAESDPTPEDVGRELSSDDVISGMSKGFPNSVNASIVPIEAPNVNLVVPGPLKEGEGSKPA